MILAGIRHFMISSLTGARTTSGMKVRTVPSFNDEGEVLAFSLSVLSPIAYSNLGNPPRVGRENEFKIRDPRLLERVIAACSATNYVSVQAAYQFKTKVFTELPVIRNFYAHRNDDTWRKVRMRRASLGAYTARTADQILLHFIPNRAVTILEDWLDDVELFFNELTV